MTEGTASMNHFSIWIDGGSRGNPGHSGVGVVIEYEGIRCDYGYYIGWATNNYAEYAACIAALIIVSSLAQKKQYIATIYADSQLLVRQLNGLYKVKNDNLKRLYAYIMQLKNGNSLTFVHVLREYNVPADLCVNRAIDNKIELPVELSFLYCRKEEQCGAL